MKKIAMILGISGALFAMIPALYGLFALLFFLVVSVPSDPSNLLRRGEWFEAMLGLLPILLALGVALAPVFGGTGAAVVRGRPLAGGVLLLVGGLPLCVTLLILGGTPAEHAMPVPGALLLLGSVSALMAWHREKWGRSTRDMALMIND